MVSTESGRFCQRCSVSEPVIEKIRTTQFSGAPLTGTYFRLNRECRSNEAAKSGIANEVNRRSPPRRSCISGQGGGGLGLLGFGEARGGDRGAGRGWLFWGEEGEEREADQDKEHDVHGTIFSVHAVHNGLRGLDGHREGVAQG